MKTPIKEVDLAAKVVTHLENEGWDVYQEVKVDSAVCDIVAKRGTFVITIECKLILSWELLAQADGWIDYATQSFIAVPWAKRDWTTNGFMQKLLKKARIGCFIVGDAKVSTWHYPEPNREANTGYFTEALRPEHKTHAKAGGNSGGYWTPFAGVASAVAIYVSEHPGGVTIKELSLLPECKKHYKTPASAISAIRQYCKRGVIKHVRVEEQGGRSLVYPHRIATSNEPRI